MSVLADFFKGSDTKLGVFYPNHYLVAVFRDPEKADAAVQKLLHAGFERSDAIATDGSAVIELDKEETGLTTFVMQAMSRFFATEQLFTDTPSISTVQAPQLDVSHPTGVPVLPRVSRR